MKRLLRYFRTIKKEVIIGPLFKAVEVVFELMIPLVVANIIDIGIPAQDRGYLVRAFLLMLGLGLAGFCSTLIAQYCSAKAAAGFAEDLKNDLIRHIQRLSYTETDLAGTDELIMRTTGDVNQLQTGINLFLRLFTRSPFVVFGAMVMAFTIDTRSAMIFVVSIPVLTLIIFGVMFLTMPLYKKIQSQSSVILGNTRENLSGTRVVRAWRREEEEAEHFYEATEILRRLQLKAGRLSSLMNPLTFVIVNTAIILLLWTGALKVDGGTLARGNVVALINYMSQILVELIKLANLIITVTKSLSNARRIEEVLEIPTESDIQGTGTDGTFPTGSVLFDHVFLHYRTAGSESLQDISFEALPGETVGVIGGTGSGKSSLVQLIPGFYPPTGGNVLVHGRSIGETSLQALRRSVGIVPQRAVLVRGTIRDNVRWGDPQATDGDIRDALVAAQAWEFVSSLPDTLDYMVEEGGKNLSGGQRQRLTIARALVRKPAILILDDSASALDYLTDSKLRDSLHALPFHPTTFIVSQRTTSVSTADRILVLDNGRLVGNGSHEELLTGCPVYREIYDSQFKGGRAV